MRASISPRRQTWWWVFSLLIALPAIVLAVLGLRAIHADQIERVQQRRDQQALLARLADAALGNLVDRLAGDLRAHAQGPLQSLPLSSRNLPVFAVDSGDVLVFRRDRVYFGPLGRHPRAVQAIGTLVSPRVNGVVEQAEAAEAQHRRLDAIEAYKRAADDERLRPWAEFHLAMLSAGAGDRRALVALADRRWARPDALTPSGLPLALLAMSYSLDLAPADRNRFTPLMLEALENLRSGQWWLSADQRRAYDRDLREWLQQAGTTTGGDARLTDLAIVEDLARRAWARDRKDTHPARFEHNDMGPALIAWSPPLDSSGDWLGVVISGVGLQRLLTDALANVAVGTPIRLQTAEGASIWTNTDRVRKSGQNMELRAVPGLQLGLHETAESVAGGAGRPVFYGVVGLPLVLLAVGLVMTARVVQREMALSRMHGSFVAAVSHEFKSPIASIRLLMERLSTGKVDDTATTTRYYDAIAAETDRLEALVNRLLESQKIQSGQKEYVLEPVCLKDTVESVVHAARARAEAKQIRIDLSAETPVPALPLDRAAIGDAIGNLLDNAIKYSPPDTRISIRLAATSREVQLDVTDQGIGIEREDLGRIFEPFYRGRRGDLQNVQGTGLGLALVKTAIEAHAGTVQVWSHAGHGSRFTLRLPVSG